MDLIDYRDIAGMSSDQNGRITYPALIPGAIYEWFPEPVAGPPIKFKVRSGEHLDLPDIRMVRPNNLPKKAD